VKVRDLYQSDETFTARSMPPERDGHSDPHIVESPRPTTIEPESEKPEAPTADPTEGRIIAVLIASEVLGCDIWFALDDSFEADDGLAVFYPDELPFLATKDAEQLREIHKVKLAFPGSRARQ
jgi:hypothetical protein